MNSSPSALPRSDVGSAVTPLLRAVLLADLVDSTGFVQRFGDARAAVAFQRLDLQIRDLLEFTGGRLIDKADGLLALFERPVQAVDFALRYQQALRHFSTSEGVQLTARVGIHVGEVMTWSNTPEAVAQGAKPLEVEGLAKPVAARLMALALPGQILISSMAQALAQRAQSELGERGERVRWISHGRYRFKGVPAPLIVHEVGETGFAPLKKPPSGQKSWLEVPIWRRPQVLAVELLVFLGIGGFYAYGLLRSPPALAFGERDWVVVGDVSNFTADPRLDDSLETALRISLDQSRFLNVVPELKVEEVLRRMGRNEDTTVDRSVGSEIALREGARALLLPSVTEVGGRLRISMELVDPNTHATVFAGSAEGRGADSALASLDTVTSQLRGQLGETMPNIRASNAPLAMVTTGNLDALRAYSLALTAYERGHDSEALGLYQEALALDPQFAMAQAGMARLRARNGELALARKLATSARDNRSRLSLREAMEVNAFLARFGSPAEALAKFRLWATMYPDSFKAYYGYALVALENNAYPDALQFLAPALSPKNPGQRSAYYLQGAILLALNRYAEAHAAFQLSEATNVAGEKLEIAEVAAAQRDFPGAARVLRAQQPTGMQGRDARLRMDDPLFLLDQGKWDEAMVSFEALYGQVAPASPLQARALEGMRLSILDYSSGLKPGQWQAYAVAQERRLAETSEEAHLDAVFPLLAAGWLAAHHGDTQTAQHALSLTRELIVARGGASVVAMQSIVEAELALQAKKPETAIAKLRGHIDGSELYFSHAVLMRAYAAAGNNAAALEQANWLASERGRAYGEWNSWDMWNAANVIESNLAMLSAAEFAMKLGQPQLARKNLQSFLRAWPNAAKLPFVEPRLQALRAAFERKPAPTT